MRVKSTMWALIGKIAAVCLAGAGIALLYRSGLADIGGALALSAIIVTLITVVSSGALSAKWLMRRDTRSIIRLGHLELAKSFGCAGVGIDVFRALIAGIRHGFIPNGALTGTIILTVAVVSAMGAGLFFGAMVRGVFNRQAPLIVTRAARPRRLPHRAAPSSRMKCPAPRR